MGDCGPGKWPPHYGRWPGEILPRMHQQGVQSALTDFNRFNQATTGNYVGWIRRSCTGSVIKEFLEIGSICFRYCPGVWPINRLKTTLMYSGCSKPESSEIRSKVKSVSVSNCLMRLT